MGTCGYFCALFGTSWGPHPEIPGTPLRAPSGKGGWWWARYGDSPMEKWVMMEQGLNKQAENEQGGMNKRKMNKGAMNKGHKGRWNLKNDAKIGEFNGCRRLQRGKN